MPMIAFIGVLISWLMFARNWPFASVAASACCSRIQDRVHSGEALQH